MSSTTSEVLGELKAAGEVLAATPVFLMHATDDRTVSVHAMTRWGSLFPRADRREIGTGGHQFPDPRRRRPVDRVARRYAAPRMSETTPALDTLAGTDLRFAVKRTQRARSAEESATFQGIGLGQLLRTIVIRRGEDDYVFVLVPGGRQIDWPKLRAHLGVSRLSLPDAEEAKAATGYERGAITPFGATSPWPVIADVTIPDEPVVAIGGGGHGINLHVAGPDLVAHLGADVVDITKPDDR